LLSAYFRDIAHRKTMLELLHERDVIQNEARAELRRKFHEFDIQCVDVLIGKPTTDQEGGKIESLLEQLRLRQLSLEQLETFERQRQASEKLRLLNEAKALAEMQTQLTNARVQAHIAESHGEAELARAKKQAEQTIVTADAELQRAKRQAEQSVVLAESEKSKQILEGQGESQRAMQVGLAQAAVLTRNISSYGDPRLYALSRMSEMLGSGDSSSGLLGTLLGVILAEKSGFEVTERPETAELTKLTERIVQQAMQKLHEPDAVSS